MKSSHFISSCEFLRRSFPEKKLNKRSESNVQSLCHAFLLETAVFEIVYEKFQEMPKVEKIFTFSICLVSKQNISL